MCLAWHPRSGRSDDENGSASIDDVRRFGRDPRDGSDSVINFGYDHLTITWAIRH